MTTEVIEIFSNDTVAIDISAGGLTLLSEQVISLVSEGTQGPPGIPGEQGAQGVPGGTLIQRQAAANLGGHRVVLMNAQGKVDYASNDTLAHASRIVGLTTGAVVTDAEASVQVYGELVEPSWNWNLSLPVYLGTTGNLTQTPPVAPGAQFSIVVGFPISSTSLFVNIREPIIIN